MAPRNAKEEEWDKFQADIEQEAQVYSRRHVYIQAAEAMMEEDMAEAMSERARYELIEEQ